MRLRIVALGHRLPAWVTEAVADYTKRLPREFAFALVELKPAPRDRGRTVPQLLADEARRLCTSCEGARIVALDERGIPWTTRALAERFERWQREGADVAFVIGSADGLDPGFKARAAVNSRTARSASFRCRASVPIIVCASASYGSRATMR